MRRLLGVTLDLAWGPPLNATAEDTGGGGAKAGMQIYRPQDSLGPNEVQSGLR
jgi:hypothetical protein